MLLIHSMHQQIASRLATLLSPLPLTTGYTTTSPNQLKNGQCRYSFYQLALHSGLDADGIETMQRLEHSTCNLVTTGSLGIVQCLVSRLDQHNRITCPRIRIVACRQCDVSAGDADADRNMLAC